MLPSCVIIIMSCCVLFAAECASAPEGASNRPAATTVPAVAAHWPGWKATFRDDRYNQFLSHIQFHALHNFTQVGYELMDVPADVLSDLQAVLRAGLSSAEIPGDAPRQHKLLKDAPVNVVRHTGIMADFIPNDDGNVRILTRMQPILEAWAGVSLVPTAAFGLRVYRLGNTLEPHVDRVDTHVISAIVHVDHDTNAPWPIAILNNTGQPAMIDIPAGKMLLYESARLMHWRPGHFLGTYYSSLFIHYRPANWAWTPSIMNSLLPARWDRGTTNIRPPPTDKGDAFPAPLPGTRK